MGSSIHDNTDVFWGLGVGYQVLLWLLGVWRLPRTAELLPNVFLVSVVIWHAVLSPAHIPPLDSLALAYALGVPVTAATFLVAHCCCCCAAWQVVVLAASALASGFLLAKGSEALETRRTELTPAEPGQSWPSDVAWGLLSVSYCAWALAWWKRQHRSDRFRRLLEPDERTGGGAG